MEVKAIYRSAKISAFKAREVTREIQGLTAQDALDLLRWTPKKAARMIDKTLRSAIANAENNNNLRSENLIVKEAIVGEGPSQRRYQPKARGSAGPIIKRASHIRIVLTDEGEAKTAKADKKKDGEKKSAKGKSSSRKTAKTEVKPKAQKAAAEENTQE
ncbi:MAG: 50S ribosomal protein L22 [Chthoniobacterales bacterium]